MFDYGQAPAPDEAELIVFGPGYGEAIAVHFGDGCWLLVDSCLTPSNKVPASIDYLNRIGVPTSSVRAIVASHWHDDHVKGLAAVVKACPHADLFLSGVFNNAEAAAFLAAYGGDDAAVHTGGTKELHAALMVAESSICVLQRSIILEDRSIQGRYMRAVALSPAPPVVDHFIAHAAKYLAAESLPIQHAPGLKPNLEAVVISIDLGGDGILLGSDLEDHGEMGWSAIVGNEWCLKNQRASAYKVAHHGSVTGHHDDIWKNLLTSQPTSVLTPFHNGAHKLPNPDDQIRIAGLSRSTFISSTGSKRPQLDSALHKQMSLLGKNIRPVLTGFGAVRFRKILGATDWSVDLFGSAARI